MRMRCTERAAVQIAMFSSVRAAHCFIINVWRSSDFSLLLLLVVPVEKMECSDVFFKCENSQIILPISCFSGTKRLRFYFVALTHILD